MKQHRRKDSGNAKMADWHFSWGQEVGKIPGFRAVAFSASEELRSPAAYEYSSIFRKKNPGALKGSCGGSWDGQGIYPMPLGALLESHRPGLLAQTPIATNCLSCILTALEAATS